MRTLLLVVVAAAGLLGGAPARAADEPVDEGQKPMTREEIRERRRELREEERRLREEERAQERDSAERRRDEALEEREERLHRLNRPRAWVGFGAGFGFASVDVPCTTPSSDRCTESGQLGTYSANVTLAGPHGAIRARGVRQQDKGDDSRTPYETAAMIGTRFGHSNWYGFAGVGRVLHPDDEFVEDDTHGFAWEIVFAPSSYGPTGFELSFQGNSGDDVDYVAFNVGGRFGLLR